MSLNRKVKRAKKRARPEATQAWRKLTLELDCFMIAVKEAEANEHPESLTVEEIAVEDAEVIGAKTMLEGIQNKMAEIAKQFHL